MLNISDISEFVYCPAKLYLKYAEDIDIESNQLITGKIIQEARMGFEKFQKHNIWNINKDMEISQIQKSMLDRIPQYLEKLHDKYIDYFDSKETANIFFKELKEEFIIEASINVLKAKKLMESTGKQGMEICEILFPQSLLGFSLKSKELNLKGKIDKIEIIDGIYFPVIIKNTFPPSKGIWLSDALQIAAYSLLIEYELNKEVLVGFIYYTKVFEKRPVVINTDLVDILSKVLGSIKEMFEREEIPEFKITKNKCKKCVFIEFCANSVIIKE